ncbi:alanine dehydrogenase [Sediminitomix flava]|uniref:alanine dehydrogenase n=2 Tax=Sediminitomix flava TaxID=379075 RepID=A0A315Z6D3_SEDFL|nr:alanine dehydrogenase [Sediminitomix flava]
MMGEKDKKEGLSRQEEFSLTPQELLVEEAVSKSNRMTIGVPCETDLEELRVMIKPEAVTVLTANGFEVRVENGAGIGANHSDQEYADAGAIMTSNHEDVFKSDIVLKINPPTLEEISFMRKGKTVVSVLQFNSLNKEYLKAVNQKKLTCVAFNYIEDRVAGLPFVRAMSEIAGSTVMLVAAEYMSNSKGGRGVILGGITGVPSARVVILGAGTVAEYAARTAAGLGAEVKVFDNHIYKLRRLKEKLGQFHLFTSAIDNLMLEDAISRADVVVGALRNNQGRCPTVVTEEVVSKMKENAIIIDVSIDHGGCFETSEPTTHQNPTFKKYGVIHYCVPNIASRVSQTATAAISNIFTPYLISLSETGSVEKLMLAHQGFTKGVYAYRGSMTNDVLASQYGMSSKDLNLILAASMETRMG